MNLVSFNILILGLFVLGLGLWTLWNKINSSSLQRRIVQLESDKLELERLVVNAWRKEAKESRDVQLLLSFILHDSQRALDFLTTSDQEILDFRNENKENIKIQYIKYQHDKDIR